MFVYKNLNAKDLKNIKFTVNSVWDSPKINGVYYKKLNTRLDGRGDLTELWSSPWSKKENIEKNVKHVYFNTTNEGVLKAWHVHESTISQYTCVSGKLQVVLVDVRKNSDTFGMVDQFVIGTKNPSYIRIPAGVLKGWKSLKEDSVIVNLLTKADVSDNFKYSWDLILTDIWEPRNG